MSEECGELRVDERVVLRYTTMTGSPPTADVTERLGDIDAVVPQVLDQLAGWRIATSDMEFAAALLVAGCGPVRHSHVLSCDFRASPPQASWQSPAVGSLRIQPLGDVTLDLVDLLLSAYPPGHPDSETSDPRVVEQDLRGLIEGRVIGPLMSVSRRVVDGDRTVAVLIVNRMPGAAPLGGPWVSDICRDPGPAYAGLGSAMLRLAMARLAADGEAALSLAVTDGNRARDGYERLGFQHIETARKLLVPTK